MLLETTFRIGGWILLALGALFGGALVATGAMERDLVLVLPTVPFFLLGVIFLLVGRDAQQYRARLMALGLEGSSEPGPDAGEAR